MNRSLDSIKEYQILRFPDRIVVPDAAVAEFHHRSIGKHQVFDLFDKQYHSLTENVHAHTYRW